MDSLANDYSEESRTSSDGAPSRAETDGRVDDAWEEEEEGSNGGLYFDDPDDDEDEEEDVSEQEDSEDEESETTPSPAPRPSQTAGPGQHLVQPGESLISLGLQYKIDPQRFLDHPENQHLRDQDRETAILNPGDIIALPERSPQTVNVASEQRHRFVYRARFTTLCMKFQGPEGPLADEPYLLEVANQQYQGQLDSEGGIEQRVSADARAGLIRIGADGEHVVEIDVGFLNPIREISGI